MQTNATIVLGDWEIVASHCHFTCTGRRQSRTRVHDGYQRIQLPFSVDTLLQKHIAFGLVSYVSSLLGTIPCVAMVADHCTGPSAPVSPTVVPCLVLNFTDPLAIWLHISSSNATSSHPSFCIFFVSPVPPEEMTTYVFYEDAGSSHDGEMHPSTELINLDHGETLLMGELKAISLRTYVTYFTTRETLAYMDLLSFEATDTDKSGRQDFVPKYLTVAKSGDLYKLTAYNTRPQRTARLDFRMTFRTVSTPKTLVLGQASPLIPTPLGAQILALYPDSEKTIQPGETAALRIQLLFEQPDRDTRELAFIVSGIANQETFIAFPSIVRQNCPEQLWIFNPNTHPIQIKRDTVVATAMACHICAENRSDPENGFCPADKTWRLGSYRIPPGAGGVRAPKCHVTPRELQFEEAMSH
ncbi:G10 [Colobine gammaherpesvirus 1]|uniref:G10 n=1 Tax=Colobine gammaherpesvirus 1 TaxID=2597325 RepID=A0A5B8G893_9GAMA|nr:G10 [Colobine gammaherpesvirus 1]QDQ69217.1 G10 [Colobine gammaherpesvirus 1]